MHGALPSLVSPTSDGPRQGAFTVHLPASRTLDRTWLESFVLDGLYFDRRPRFRWDDDGTVHVEWAANRAPLSVSRQASGCIVHLPLDAGPRVLELVDDLARVLA